MILICVSLFVGVFCFMFTLCSCFMMVLLLFVCFSRCGLCFALLWDEG